jgi:signal peptidase I
MAPTLVVGDSFLVDKLARRPDRGDVIAFEFPLDRSTDYVKRVVALGGDTVEIAGRQLIVNGKEVWRERVQNGCAEGTEQAGIPCVIWEETLGERRYQVGFETGALNDMARRLVPPDTVFVLGDNRDNSSDSRVWGPVPLENIKGTARFIWWSTGPDGRVRWDRVNAPLR